MQNQQQTLDKVLTGEMHGFVEPTGKAPAQSLPQDIL
jgi:hypothetical protein